MSNADTLACVALIVRDPFENYKRGDCIRDAQLIQKILESNQVRHVNRISIPVLAQELPDEEPGQPTLKVTPKPSKKSKE